MVSRREFLYFIGKSDHVLMAATQKCSFPSTLWMNASNSFGDTHTSNTEDAPKRTDAEHISNVRPMPITCSKSSRKVVEKSTYIYCVRIYHPFPSKSKFREKIVRANRKWKHEKTKSRKKKNWHQDRKLSDDYFIFSLLTQFLRIPMTAVVSSKNQTKKKKKQNAIKCADHSECVEKRRKKSESMQTKKGRTISKGDEKKKK